MIKALIFDVDGTLADTESLHRAAFNRAFSELNLGWEWSDALYTELLKVSGGKERIAHFWRHTGPAFDELAADEQRQAIDRIHALKTAHYEAAVNAGGLALRPGVQELIQTGVKNGLRLAIATTTSPVNISALLSTTLGSNWGSYFEAIGDAVSAPIKKPHPQVYLQVLEKLKLPAGACLAFEDSSNGLRASLAAGIATIVTPTRYTADDDFSGAYQVLPDLSHFRLDALTI